jgi:hypothetical protein
MIFPWPEDVLGEPPSAWVWYTSTELDTRDTSFKLDAAEALINEFVLNLTYRERLKDILVTAIRASLDELGVPGEGYPAPVSNAVEYLSEALKNGGWSRT